MMIMTQNQSNIIKQLFLQQVQFLRKRNLKLNCLVQIGHLRKNTK